MIPRESSPAEAESHRQRESIRRGLLRANTAVAVVLLAVVGLGGAAVVFGYRAARNQRRAEQAEARGREQLEKSYLAQAQALRLTTRMGRREEALTAVSNAAALRPSLELRNEAIACLALSDLEVEWSRPVPAGVVVHTPDRQLERYATAALDDTQVAIRRLADGTVLQTLYVTNSSVIGDRRLVGATFSRGGRFFSTQFRDGATVIWDTRSGRPVCELAGNAARSGGGSLSFSSDDAAQAAVSDVRQPRQFVVADLRSGRHRVAPVSSGPRGIVRISPDGRSVAVASGAEVVISQLTNGAVVHRLRHDSEVRAVSWEDSGRRIAVACYSGDVHLWEIEAGRARVLAGPTSLSWWLEFSPDGSKLATVSLDGQSRVWETRSGRLLFHTSSAQAVYFNADGTRLAFEVPEKTIGVWRLSGGGGFRSARAQLGDGAMMWNQDLSPDGRWAAWVPASWSPPLGLELLDAQSGRSAFVLPGQGLRTVAFHPRDPKLLVVQSTGAEWRELRLATAATGPSVSLGPPDPIRVPGGLRIWCAALGGDGRTMAVQAEDGRLFAVDLSRSNRVVTLDGRSTGMSSPGPAGTTGTGRHAVSPDGRWVAVAGGLEGGGTQVWDAQDGRRVAHLQPDEGTVGFSPDGRWLVVAGTGQIGIWSTADWKRRWRKPGGTRENFHVAAAFSGDGTLLAFTRGGEGVQLCDAATGGELATLRSPMNPTYTGLRLAGDGTTLVLPGANSTMETWDLGELRRRLASLGLDWGRPLLATAVPGSTGGTAAMIAVLVAGFLLVVVAAGVVLLALGRHRSLVHEFVQSEARARRRLRELEVARVELMHSQKMKALGTLAAGIAHDFNNLLSVIRMSNQLVTRATRGNPDVAEEVANIEEAVQQGKQVVGSMLGYSRERGGDANTCDLDEVVEETVSLLSREFLSGIELTLALDRHVPPVRGGRGRLEQILMNLVVNASEAMQGRGRLRIAVHPAAPGVDDTFVLRPRESGPLVELSVSDSGAGIAPDVLPRIFEPFFTTKITGARQGTGLGLSMVYTIAEQDGLGLAVESEPGAGATFRVLVPCAPVAQFPPGAGADTTTG